MLAEGKVLEERADGFMVFVPCIHHKEQIRQASEMVTVEFDDGRGLTAAQRRKAYVLLGYISEWTGYTPLETVKELTKFAFMGTGYTCKRKLFSLSDCDRTTARMYITFLIDFCIINHINCGEPLWKLCEDIPKYIYACLMNKACAVCGKKAELHHVDAVGTGRNRKEICHIGMRCLPLCRKHHNEIHNIGKDDFMKRYMIQPIKIDERIADFYKLKGK